MFFKYSTPLPSQSHSEMKGESRFHFVLVHGAGFGGWCWYKVADLLTKTGLHTITVSSLDMASGGIDPTDADTISSLDQYNNPLTDFLSALSPHSQDKVILVGHSAGGYNLTHAMELFPHKISAAVFVAAFMPLSGTTFSHSLNEVVSRIGSMKDTAFYYANGEENSPTSFKFGDQFSEQNLLQNSPSCDKALTKTLLKKFPLWQEAVTYSNENYGSVFRAYVVAKEDLAIVEELQRKMIADNPPQLVYEIEDSDHSPFFSNPDGLAHILLQIATHK